MTSFIPQNQWPNTDRAKQFRLFATRTKELLHPEAQDIYRVHAVSSLGKIEELESCCVDVLNGQYPKAALSPIILEVNECLETDLVIKRIIRKNDLPHSNTKFDIQRSSEAILSRARLWRQLLTNNYEEMLKREIVLCFRDTRLKKKLLICAKLYASHLLYRGFHRDFILDVVERTFFHNRIGQCTDAMIERFFANFESSNKEFKIILFGSEATLSIFQPGKLVSRVDSEDDLKKAVNLRENSGLPELGNRKAVVLHGIEGTDPYSALKKASLIFALPQSFGIIYPSPEKLELDNRCVVVDNGNNRFHEISRSDLAAPVHSYTSQISYSQEMFSAFAGYLWSVTDNRDQIAFSRLQRSLESANSALKAESAATQLVSLWSAFEALLPPPAKDEKNVRIKHFVHFIVPCVSRKYIRGKFRIFIDDVSRHSTGNFESLLGQELSREDKPKELARLLLTDTAERRSLFTTIQDSPILLQRLFELGKLVTDPARVKAKQDSHEKRVEWQLYRIYRERNLIVHSGRNSDCLPILVENLFLYYRLLMRALQQIHRDFQIYETDSALELVAALHNERQNRFDDILRDTGNRDFHSSFLSVIFGN